MIPLALPPPARAAETGGFAELRASLSQGVDGAPLQVVERLRPSFSAGIGERVLLASTVELGLAQGRKLQDELRRTIEDSELGPLLEAADCTWPGHDNDALGISRAADYLSVERLYLDAYLPRADLRLGRQAIHWGSALMVNPTDPFPEVLLTEPWRPRAGVNALRATVPVGQVDQVQLLAGLDDDLQKLRLAGRATANAWSTDLSLAGAWRQETGSGLVGLDLRGSAAVGFWAEGAWHLGEQPYGDLAVGIDYSFPLMQSLLASAQYYRNGAGSAELDPGSLVSSMGSAIELPDCPGMDLQGSAPQPDPFAPFLHGRDYAMLMLALSTTPDSSAGALWVQNLGDGSALVVPTISLAPLGWLEISATAQLPVRTWGDGGEFSPAPQDLVMEVQLAGGVPPLEIDASGLVPAATWILWTRASF